MVTVSSQSKGAYLTGVEDVVADAGGGVVTDL